VASLLCKISSACPPQLAATPALLSSAPSPGAGHPVLFRPRTFDCCSSYPVTYKPVGGMSSGGNRPGSSSLPLSNADVSALSSVVAAAVSRTLAQEQSQRRGSGNERNVLTQQPLQQPPQPSPRPRCVLVRKSTSLEA